MRAHNARRRPQLAAALVGACLALVTTLTAAQSAVFTLVDNTNLQPNTYKIYVMGHGVAANGTPLTLQSDGSWAAPATGTGTLTLPCYEFTGTPRQISQIQISPAQAGLSVRAYYFIVTDFTKFPSCNPTGGHSGMFNNPQGFTYTYPSGGTFTLTVPPPTTVTAQTFPAWTFSEIGASSTAATNDLSQVDFFSFPMNMQATVTAANPPNPTQVGNPVGLGNPNQVVNHASIRDAYAQWADALAQSAGSACSNPTPPSACEWRKLLLDIPPSPPQSMIPQYVLQNPQTYLAANPSSSLHRHFDGVIATLWAASGAPTLTLNSGGAIGAIPQDNFVSSIVTMTYPTALAGPYQIKAMKFVGQNSGYIAYVFDPAGLQAGCEAMPQQIPAVYCSNPKSAGYQVFAGAGALAGPANNDNWTTLNATPGALKPGTANGDYNNLVARLGLLIAGAMNRGVALVPCTGQQTWQCWQNETYWYPTTVSATFPDITQNLYSYWMHTASIQGTPIFVQPPGALSHASSVPGGGAKKMGMAYGFSVDEDPTPNSTPPQPEVPSKFDNTIIFPSTGTITFGPWLTSNMLLVSLSPNNGGTVTSSPSGISCNPTCSNSYPTGTAVTLTATPASGFVFSNWSGACSGTTTTCNVTVNATTSVVANFTAIAPTSFPLNVVVSGAGTVSSGPPGIDCPALACSVAFATNTLVTLTAAPSPGSIFVGWSGACTGTAITCQVTMSAARNVGAAFASTAQVTLTVSGGIGGVVTSVPGGIDCGTTCIAGYAFGTLVSLVATPNPGFVFTGWTGACSGTNVCDLTMDSNKSVGAMFSSVAPGQFALTVSDFGNGTIVSFPAGINCGTTCATSFPAGTQVTLVATAGAGYAFAGWSGACTGLGACVVLMDQAQAVQAIFVPNAAPIAAQEIPTLSQWGLLLMCGLVALVAFADRRRRR